MVGLVLYWAAPAAAPAISARVFNGVVLAVLAVLAVLLWPRA